jgi:hypothetical protein
VEGESGVPPYNFMVTETAPRVGWRSYE